MSSDLEKEYEARAAEASVSVMAASSVDPVRLKQKRQTLEARRVQFATQLMALMREGRAQLDDWNAAAMVSEEADFTGAEVNGVRLTQVDKALYDQSTTVINTILTAFNNNGWNTLFSSMIQ